MAASLRSATTLPTRPLGRTGITVPLLGLGTVKLGRNTAVKYPTPFDLPPDQQAIELLLTARSLGVNLLDTAPAYGTSEQRLGQLLADTQSLGQRDQWLIATKAGETFDPAAAESRFDFSADAITDSIHRSLRLLRTDYLDIALLHSDGNDLHILHHTASLDALRRLKEQGKIRAIGISTKTPEGAAAALPLVDVLMLTVNPAYHADRPIAALAQQQGVGVLVKKALLSGHVSRNAAHPEPGIAPTPAQCLQHAANTPGVGGIIVGTLSPKHLIDNANAVIQTLN